MDKWFAEDKWNHLTGSFFTTFVFFWLLHLTFNFYAAWIQAGIYAFLVGIVVEIYQESNKIDKFSLKDVCANLIGTILACWWLVQ